MIKKNIQSTEFFYFPNKNHFAESFIIENNNVYIPLNTDNTNNNDNTNNTDNSNNNNTDANIDTDTDANSNIYSDITNNSNSEEINKGGLYCLNLETKMFTSIFYFQPNEIIFVAKKTSKYFICNVTTTNTILLYNYIENTRTYIPIIGCPNDLCIDPNNDNIIYIAINIKYKRWEAH